MNHTPLLKGYGGSVYDQVLRLRFYSSCVEILTSDASSKRKDGHHHGMQH